METFLDGVRVAKVKGLAKAGDPLGRLRVIGGRADTLAARLARAGVDAHVGGGPASFVLACDIAAADLESLAPKLGEMGKRGLVAVPVSLEKPLSWWRGQIPEAYEVLADTEAGWTEATRGDHLTSILLVAPSIYPVRRDLRYAGIERLIALFAYGLAERGYTVYVAGATGTAVHPKVWWLNTGAGQPLGGDIEEEAAYHVARLLLEQRPVDVVHDFSHRHLLMRRHKVKGVAMIWHDPKIMTPPEPGYNVATLSEWQAQRFRETTKQDARALDVVCTDDAFYRPYFERGLREVRKNVFVTMGKMGPTKGNLAVAQMCYGAGAGLDVIGGFGVGDDPAYAQQVAALQRAGDAPIVYRGEVSEEAKAHLLATAQGLLYAPNFGPGMGESHLHKCIDAAAAGCPSLLLDQGAYRECIEENVAALFARDMGEMQAKLPALAKMDRTLVRDWAVKRYGVDAVLDRWIPEYEKLAAWESWS